MWAIHFLSNSSLNEQRYLVLIAGEAIKPGTMKEEDVNCCQIQEWYPKFKSVSIKTIIHELPESFVEYLLLKYFICILKVYLALKILN
ncbi:hypothetical protein POPTR_017G049500v4 [Populus trichocarpa]|uniref:Uncharacterized protein n=1 Tax=Populus trichocarpa TaxID=3694 RepID=A0ACC0RPS8_POPTR|nr:hypothetical protein BDE02_17G038700 [Populus trichocarpa]KAI9379133.1 hypothetical protein POPTR_017G049500v4 [Populus trichocarpa]